MMKDYMHKVDDEAGNKDTKVSVTKEQAELLQFVDWGLADRRRIYDSLATHKLAIKQIQTVVNKLTTIQGYWDKYQLRDTGNYNIFENLYYWLNELRDIHSDYRDEYDNLKKEITP